MQKLPVNQLDWISSCHQQQSNWHKREMFIWSKLWRSEQSQWAFKKNWIYRAKTVLCYRMTPSEKALIVNTVKKKIKGNVLAIGDGANDVPMIQAAHVGIGIAGKEGLQAAMACDFAIARFKFLSRLLLVHGHWSYYRLANTFLYFLYKNAVSQREKGVWSQIRLFRMPSSLSSTSNSSTALLEPTS